MCRAEKGSATIVFTGDIMMHYAVKGCAARHDPENKNRHTVEGFNYLFAKIAPLLRSADCAIGNMEFPVSPPFVQNEFIFNCPPQVIPSLHESGFRAVTVANNHLLDQRSRGVLDTFGFLEKEGLPYFGAARDEKTARTGFLFEKNGIRVRILSYTGILNNKYPDNPPFYINRLNDHQKLMEDIAAARKDCDFLIIQPHAGVEYTLVPPEEVRELYQSMIDSGADLVIGHHPHVLQYIEGMKSRDGRRCAIFYSLGNFICNQDYTFPVKGSSERYNIRDSAVVFLSFTKEDDVVSWSAKVEPVFTAHDIRRIKGVAYKDIRTVVLRDEIALLDAVPDTKKKEKASAMKRAELYRKKIAVIKKVLFRKGDVEGVSFAE
jgi:hypothetical protein